MITVFLRGGLGNQMFQYALGLNLSRRNNTQLRLDTVFLNDRFPRRQFTYRNFDLDIFTLDPEFTALSRASMAVPIPGAWLGVDLALIKVEDMLGIQKLVKEKKDYHFDPEVLRVAGSALLWGRWHSAKYFEGIEDALRLAFRFRQPLAGEALRLAGEIKNSNSVALHVRRADYLLPKYRSAYGETNLSYYDEAIQHVAAHVPNPKFFVFSDDIAWCKENIKMPHPMEFVEPSSAGPKNAFHLELLSLCEHAIIANSSFSWWGAWLNANKEKIVVAPKLWEVGKDSPDAVPKNWIRL